MNSNKEMLDFFFFRSSRNSYSNLAKGGGEIFGFFVWSIVFGLEEVFLDELGVVSVKREYCLGEVVVGEEGLGVPWVSLGIFLLELLVVMTFCEMCTYSNSSSSSPKDMSQNEFNYCSIDSLDSWGCYCCSWPPSPSSVVSFIFYVA